MLRNIFIAALTATLATGWSKADAAEAGSAVPFGPDWSIVENQPCQVWNDGISGRLEPFTWSGACVNGKASGEGRLTSTKYNYEGSMRSSKLHGYGIGTFSYGEPYGNERYEGQFRDGWEHGHGTMTWTGGQRCEGRVGRRQTARIRDLYQSRRRAS